MVCCIFPAVNKCNRGDEKVSEEVKKEAEATVTGDKLHESGEAKMNKTSSIKVTVARQCKDKGMIVLFWLCNPTIIERSQL